MSEQRYSIKMYQSKMFKHITMYKTIHLDETWEGSMEDDWDVEVKDDKARVYSNSPFAKNPSRFNKLTYMGKTDGNLRIYKLTVNGCTAFFKIAYILPE